jgi:hypothetical protein
MYVIIVEDGSDIIGILWECVLVVTIDFFFGTSLRTLSTWPTLTYQGLICLFPEPALAGSHLS